MYKPFLGSQKGMMLVVVHMYMLFIVRQKEMCTYIHTVLGAPERDDNRCTRESGWRPLKPIQMYMPFTGPTKEEGCQWRYRCTVQQHILASAAFSPDVTLPG